MILLAPDPDLRLASDAQLVFGAFAKPVPRRRWTLLGKGPSLPEALELADRATQDSAEVGVFVETDSGALLYWSSSRPQLFNSVVLTHALSLNGRSEPPPAADAEVASRGERTHERG